EPSVRVHAVGNAEAARALVEGKAAGGALVIPAGTSDALASGRPARLELLTDPVRTIDVATLRALVQEARHGLETAAIAHAQDELEEARARAEDARETLGHEMDALRGRLSTLR